MTRPVAAFAALLAVSGASLAVPPLLRADGLLAEWSAESPIATDPAGDAAGPFDVTALWAQSVGPTLLLRFDIGDPRNLQEGPFGEESLRIHIDLPCDDTLVIDTRARRAFLESDPGATLLWSSINFRGQPTAAAPDAEIQIDLSPFGVALGESVSIDFSGSDSLAAPALFTLVRPPEADRVREWRRSPGAFRVASLNTFQTGLFNAGRYPLLARLLDAADADIYCLQEEYNSSAASITGRFNSMDPLDNGAPWSVHKVNDSVIAAQAPVVPMPSYSTVYAAAIVSLPAGDVLVLSIHPKCCGYAGSTEDLLRIAQTNLMIRTIDEVRAGLHGPYQNAAVVVIGDWNLVGSSTPLDILVDAAGPALSRLDIPHLVGEDVVTWRSDSVSYWPGTLDLAVYSAQTLAPKRRFALDTAALAAPTLAEMGLQAGDSGGSDHLLLVADFAFGMPCAGDADLDGDIDFTDLNLLLGDYNRAGASLNGDFDGDGDVDFSDLNLLLPRLNTACAGLRAGPRPARPLDLVGAPAPIPAG